MKALEALLLLVGGFLVVAVAIGAMSYQPLTNASAHQTQAQTQQVQSSSLVVTGPPTVTVDFINKILSQAQSPAVGTGQALYNLGVQYGIDPAYALAFFQHESGYGKYGAATTTRSLGNLRCFCSRVWQHFSTWQEGYEAWYKLIAGPMYVQGGLKTIPQIIHKYAPASDGNNEQAYVQAVETAVKGWRQAE